MRYLKISVILILIISLCFIPGCSETNIGEKGQDIYNKMEEYANDKNLGELIETYGTDIYETTKDIIEEQLKD